MRKIWKLLKYAFSFVFFWKILCIFKSACGGCSKQARRLKFFLVTPDNLSNGKNHRANTESNFLEFWTPLVWHSSAQPLVICVFELVYLNDLDYFSLRAGPPLWPLLQWISRWYCRRAWRQMGPNILNICHTESCRTENWGRISPGVV